MDLDSELAKELERAIPHLPTSPASAHLSAGRRARHRRHVYAGVAGVAVLALTTGAAVSAISATSPTGGDRTRISDTPSSSSTEVPSWAEEHGNYGPISMYPPDGLVSLAPDVQRWNLEHLGSLAERMVHLEGDGSERLVAGPGAVIVDQTDDVALPDWPAYPGNAAAKVTFEGTTWFVLAMDPAKGEPVYSAYEASVVPASTIDGFVDFLHDGGIDR